MLFRSDLAVGNREYDVSVRLTGAVLDDIVAGRETFMRAFSTGDMNARGNFPLIRQLDDVFVFGS